MSEDTSWLPPGQFDIGAFPRFGLGKFARLPALPVDASGLRIDGDVARPGVVGPRLGDLPRIQQTSDFHCVTSWSYRGARWGGVRFADFYAGIAQAETAAAADATLVVFRGHDGYACAMQLQDLLADTVLLADRLDDAPLPPEHGAPLRLVAPAHYGFKNVKHIAAIEFWRDARAYRFPFPYPQLMDHPRGRVAFEERGRWVPPGLLRFFYRLLIPGTIRNFARMTRR